MKYLGIPTIMIAVSLSFLAVPNAADAESRAEWKGVYQRPSSIPFPEDNPYTKEKERLGEMLFFDPRLSGSNSISCATCHNPSFSWGDGLATGFGHGMTRLGRRTPTVWNLAWADLLMWDGRFASLEEQALGPMGAAVEMNQDLDAVVDELSAIPGYRTRFNVVFPGEGITLGNVAKAIATFERMLVTGVTAFDSWIAGDDDAISESAKRGFDLFNDKANCAACHSGWNFTDDSFHDVGLPDDDIGRGNVVPGVTELQHAFKTPTLRNVSLRGPYMHNGAVADLAAVIDLYNDGFVERPSLSSEIKRLGLSEQEKADLAAFLQTLTSHEEAARHPILPR